MTLSPIYRRWLFIVIGFAALTIVSIWIVKKVAERTITSYFHQKLTPSPQTQITYDIADVQIGWWGQTIALQGVELLMQEEENKRDTTTYQLSFPRFSIDLTSLWDLLVHHTLGIEEISVDEPHIQVFLPSMQDSVLLQQEAGDLQQKTLWFLKQLNVKHFELLHGSLNLSVNGIPAPRYSLRNVSVYMNNLDIDVDSLSVERITELMITNHIEVILHNETILLPDAQHTLHFKQLQISSAQDAILIDSLHLYSSLKTDTLANQALDNNIQIPQLHLKGVDFLSLYLDNKLFIDTVLVGKTDLNLMVENNSISILNPLDNQENHGLDSIHIRQLQMMPGTMTVHYANDSLTNTFQVDSATLLLGNVTHSSQSDSSFSWDAEKLELQLRNYQAKLADLNYTFSFDKLNWTLKDKSFGLDGVTIYPVHDTVPLTSVRPLKYLKIPSFTIKEIDFTDLFFKRQLSSRSIDIESPTIGLLVPGASSSSTNEVPVNISEIVKQFFKTFKLGRLALHNGNVTLYHEQDSPFLTLENIGIYGHDWEMAENEEFIKEFPLEVYFEHGILYLPGYQVNLFNTHYSNTQDSLTAHRMDVKSTGLSEGLKATVQLQDVTLAGLMSMSESNQLRLLDIGNAQAKILLPEDQNQLERNTLASMPTAPALQVRQLMIENLDTEVEKAGVGAFTLQNLQANLKNVALGASALPLVFDLDHSQVQSGTASFKWQGMKGSIDSLRMQAGNVDLYNIVASSDSAAQWQFTLPVLEVDHLQFPEEDTALWRIGQIAFHQPTAKGIMVSHALDTTSQETEIIAPSFQLLLDTLLVDRAQWTIEQPATEDTLSWSGDNMMFRGYHLQYPFAVNELLNQHLSLELDDFQYKSKDAHLKVGHLALSPKAQTLALQNIQLHARTTVANIPSLQIEATLPKMQLKTNNKKGWMPAQPWVIDEFLVSQPVIALSWNAMSEVPVGSEKPIEKVEFLMPSIAINTFQIKGAQLKTQGMAEQPSVDIDGMDFVLNDIFWDTNDSLNPMALLEEGHWKVKIAHPQITLPYPPVQAHVYGLQFQNDPSHLRWDSAQWAPTVGPFEYSEYLTHQKSWLSVATGQGNIRGLQWKEIMNGSFLARKVQIEQPQISVFKDKRLPFPENHYPPMLHAVLVNLPHPIHIDTLELHDGNVEVRIRPERGEKIGHLHFSNVEGVLSNITNIPSRIEQNSIMRSDTYANIQRAGLVKTHMDFALNDPYFTFFMDVKVGKLDLRKLNTMVEPIASVRVRSGDMRKLNLKAIANNKFAYGYMDFMYRKLRLAVLSKKDHEHQGFGLALESFLANSLILRRNNGHPFPHRQGQVFVERDDTKQIFNYLGQIAVSGILTSAGVKSNRKLLKKQYDYKRKLLEEEMEEDSQVSTKRK